MKQTYLVCLALLSFVFSQAQIIDIPDANFKDALVNDNVATFSNGVTTDVDANNDGEIEVSEAEAVIGLDVSFKQITSMEGIQYFTNISNLVCTNNMITDLDMSGNLLLGQLSCRYNDIETLNVTQNAELFILYCDYNELLSLNISNNPLLLNLICSNNSLSALDVSQNTNLRYLHLTENGVGNLDISNNTELLELRCINTGLSSLDLSLAPNLVTLFCNENDLTTLDVTTNINLEVLQCTGNELTNLNLSQNINLETLGCAGNSLTDLDLSQNLLLSSLTCSNNQISSIDVSPFSDLIYLYVQDNLLTTLDVTANENLNYFNCSNNNLTSLLMKNGSSVNGLLEFEGNTNLSYVCVDLFELNSIQNKIDTYGYINCTANSYCSFDLGGTSNIVEGVAKIDTNNNGCDVSDASYPYLKYDITSGFNVVGSYLTNQNGEYHFSLNNGSYTFTPDLQGITSYTVSPMSGSANFPTDPSPSFQDYCFTINGAVSDLEVVLVPLEEARPGFQVDYKVLCYNRGNLPISGDVNLYFEDDILEFISASPLLNSQSTGVLSWSFDDLQPFETLQLNFTLDINLPTDTNPVDATDVLTYTATIESVSNEATPENNTFELNQTVVNSFDPNDKTCLEGDTISPDRVGDFVHYMIRFENTGTASAVNIVVKDVIDTAKFDISTLIPLDGSHAFVTRITETNKVEFIFENIYLPFDDANNDGYVAFKIQTQPTLVLGDTFSNTAEIYFDFNAPIITNTEVTTVEEPLSISDFELDRNITLYPNPSNGTIELRNKSGEFLNYAEVINVNGSIVYELGLETSSFSNSISLKLESGMYVFKLYTDKGSLTKKLIIK